VDYIGDAVHLLNSGVFSSESKLVVRYYLGGLCSGYEELEDLGDEE